ncbi:MAG: matrixin family metalloprotease [Actinomycetota bacterium]|nr:matrixin family metalloprotease [Actinomycetota bacterium]
MDPHPPGDDYFVGVPSMRPSQAVVGPRGPAQLRRHGRQALAVALLAALAIAALALAWSQASLAGSSPPVPGLASDVAGQGTYRFEYVHSDGAPLRWDSCTPIRYVTNLGRAPYPTALADVQMALSRITEVTGLTFTFAGETDEPPREERDPVQPERYGNAGWAPVLIAWTDPAQVPSLHGPVVGVAQIVPAGAHPVLVSGAIYLDATDKLRPGFGTGRSWGTVLLHEVGHLVGLGHVDDEREIMHPGGERGRTAATVRWGVGDSTGLRQLGLESGCQRSAQPPPVARLRA